LAQKKVVITSQEEEHFIRSGEGLLVSPQKFDEYISEAEMKQELASSSSKNIISKEFVSIKRSVFVNKFTSNSWINCVTTTSFEGRAGYCKEKFSNDYQIQKCKSNFCDTCCKFNIFYIHSNALYNCKKKCYRNTDVTRHQEGYNNICMLSQNPDRNTYSYCDAKFARKPTYNRTCKYDMCNLCCVNINSLMKKKFSFFTVRQCFKDCSKKFPGEKQLLA